ncbi:uncharacterized protein LOC119690963 [Plutella xylostella]|uniref:uncharacterized protein LOC119690963 n=1 Tax=Plutella xylostella TaxID=51655 RepID=UPI0020324D94|nr:uncharacterized protein LOC119690963 [Plutella xylostella]
MSLVLRSYIKTKKYVSMSGNTNVPPPSNVYCLLSRCFSDDKIEKDPEYNCSTIIVENGPHLQELPLIVRRAKDLTGIREEKTNTERAPQHDTHNYPLIQAEFKECLALRDVFSLLSKCTKITPNIALGAMERIYHLEKNPHPLDTTPNYSSVAKDAIVEKLLKVVMKTEETQTILNALNAISTFIEPYKYEFCDEVLLRVSENKLNLDQICKFMEFLVKNRNNQKYSEMIDKLWVGFVDREYEINEDTISKIFKLLPHFRESKKTVLNLLEQKLLELWCRVKLPGMYEILNTYLQENSWRPDSFAIIAGWLYTNIHALDDDSLLEMVTAFTKIKYNDGQIEKSIERYIRLKGSKLESPILIVGILNYCMQFRIRNVHILNGCQEYYWRKGNYIPINFIKSIIFPYGFLYYYNSNYFTAVEKFVDDNYEKFSADDVSSIILALIYTCHYPLQLVQKIFTPERLSNITDDSLLMRKMTLIDTAMTLECKQYLGPMLPKDQWSKSVSQDGRVRKIVTLIHEDLLEIAGGSERLSVSVLVPHLCSDEAYLIDIMLHPVGLGSNTFNWKSKCAKDEIVAVLVHLPEHYCSDDELVGPQEMRKRHLRLLGMKVASLKYTTLYDFKSSKNNVGLQKYLKECIDNASLSL